MEIFREINKVQKRSLKERCRGNTVGFVPTMGYLHKGHLSLIRECRENTDFCVVSIFVNPTQFAGGEDYSVYPRDEERDKAILKREKVNLLFMPEVKEMYKESYQTNVEVLEFTKPLCGKFRPGHFKGVTTVVSKLFNAVLPDVAYFGQKDYQQYLVIKRMTMDLNFPVKIQMMPIVREKDGLAMSSRNSYLNKAERGQAVALYSSLKRGEELYNSGERSSSKIKKEMGKVFNQFPLVEPQYIEVVGAEELDTVEEIQGKALIAVAAFVGKVRLIDNILLGG